MRIETARFGPRIIVEDRIITFPAGLMAFEHLNRFVLFDIPENQSFKWLQAIEDPQVAFLLVDPFQVKNDYCVDLSETLARELDIAGPGDVIVYTTVTVPKSGFRNSTTNLIGPLVINWRGKKAKQVIFDNRELSTRYPIFGEGSKKLSYGG